MRRWIGFVALALACNGSPGVPKTLTLRARGLFLSPSDPQTPDGALSRADNVVISRDGIVETRRGQDAVSTSTVRRLAAYKGALVGHDGTSTLSRSSDSGATWTAYSASVTPPAGEPLRTAEMASSLFMTDATGVKRIDALAATPETTGVPAGLDVDLTLSSAGTPTAMPNNKRLAYRILFGKRDANGRLILGAPSGRATITNTSGATRDVAVNMSIPRGLGSSNFFQVYRSIASVDQNTDPGDELGLVAEGTLPQNASVTQLVRATNVVTATTSTAHGYATGQIIRVSPGGALSSHSVMVGYSSAVSRSTNGGATWSSAGISGLSGTFRAIAYGGAQYVAVGDSVAATSTDGLTWTARTIPAGSYYTLVFTGSTWVAVGTKVATSTDGITWTARTLVAGVTLASAAWSGTLIVASGSTVNDYPYASARIIMSSPDGVTWTRRGGVLGGGALTATASSGSGYVSLGYDGSSNAVAYSSADGVTWVSRTIPALSNGLLPGSYRSALWAGSQFVAAGDYGGVATSPDGATWTARTPTFGGLNGGVYGLGVSGSTVIAVGSDDSANTTAATSTDGITWTNRTVPAGIFLSVASGGGATFAPGEKTVTGTPSGTTFTYAETGTDGTLAVAQTAEPLTAAILDTVPDGFLGASLYTNANQQGILNANERPPVATDIAEFKRSLFFANITTPAYGTAYLIAVGGSGLQSGDTVTINGLAYTAAASESISARQFKVTTSGSVSQNIRDTAASLVRVVNRSLASGATVTDISDPNGVPGYLAFRASDPSSSLAVTFSRTSAWSPAAGISEDPKTYANGFVWSKPDQPDSVPTSQILLPTLIGSADKKILRIIPTRASLFLLKEDGVWRLQGQEGSWDVQPFDPTIRVVAPETAVVLDNTIWALSEQGVVRISDTGTAVVSRPIEPALLAAISPAVRSITARLAFGIGYESDRKYQLWLPSNINLLRNSSMEVDSPADGVPDGWLVYNNGGEACTPSIQSGGVNGGRFARLDWTVANTDTRGWYTNAAKSVGGKAAGVQGGWRSGQWYTVSWWMRANAAVAAASVGSHLEFNVVPSDSIELANLPLTTEWQRYVYRLRWTGSAPGSGELFITYDGNVANGQIDIDEVQVEIGEEATDYAPIADEATYASGAFVYDHFTQAWTRRTDDASHAIVNPVDDLLYTVSGTGVTKERKTLTDADYQDATGTAISTVVEWSPRFGGSPFGLAEFQDVTILWDRARFTSATVGFATNLSQTPENVTLAGTDYACNASAVTDLRVEVWPPTEKTWGSQLSVTVSHSEAGSPNAIAGLEVTYVPSGGAPSR